MNPDYQEPVAACDPIEYARQRKQELDILTKSIACHLYGIAVANAEPFQEAIDWPATAKYYVQYARNAAEHLLKALEE